MGKHVSWLLAIGLLAVIALALWGKAGDREPLAGPPVLQSLEGLERLARKFPQPGDEPLAWPRDHGARPEQFAESWLFAGLLHAEDGRRYGFQLAFYRIAVESVSVEGVAVQADGSGGDSAWRARNIFRARLSVEPAGQPARSAERLSRDALELAGAGHAPARAWVEDWSFEATDAGSAFHLRAAEPGFGLELRLVDSGTTLLSVDRPEFRGYWWPGLAVQGTVRLDGDSVPVTGHAMVDRLWGRALPAGQGQLALARLWLEDREGRALRCEQLRRRAGGGTPLTECRAYPGVPAEVALEPADDGWRTVSGIRYPLSWKLYPAAREPLRTTPLSSRHAAFLDGSWSGIVGVRGRDQAWGLLELSNFAEP
jgi:predicted secreted hydrolase